MGLFSGISAWNANRIEKHRAKMEEKGFVQNVTGVVIPPLYQQNIIFLISMIVQAAMVVEPIRIGQH